MGTEIIEARALAFLGVEGRNLHRLGYEAMPSYLYNQQAGRFMRISLAGSISSLLANDVHKLSTVGVVNN